MTEDPHSLIARLRRASLAVYLATEEGPADDLSGMLREAADQIEADVARIKQSEAGKYLLQTPSWQRSGYEPEQAHKKCLYTLVRSCKERSDDPDRWCGFCSELIPAKGLGDDH